MKIATLGVALAAATPFAFAGGGGGPPTGTVAPNVSPPNPQCAGNAACSAPKLVEPKVPFERYRLANGLEVILAPDPSVPIVAVNIWYHVGSGYEVVGKSGFAHLFEHMMFQGSKHVGDDKHFEILKKIGADGVNGSTSLDRTNYFEIVPSNQLETGLWLESDRMGFLLDNLTKKSLDNQIEVVRNERRQNYDNRPYGKALFAEFAGLYPEDHPYRFLTIGRHEDLVAASLDDVKSFFRTWYVPANATLALVGDFESPRAKQLVEKWFGKFPKSAAPGLMSVAAPIISPSETTVDDEFAKLRQITFAWHSPALFAADDAELEIAAAALDREGPGRLYRALVYDRPIAQSVNASQSGATFSGIFSITVTLRTEAKIDEVKRIVADHVAQLGKEPLAPKEITRVIVGNEANAIRRLETVNGRANALQRYNHYLGDPAKLGWDLDRFRVATADKIRAAAAKYLVPEHMVTVITMPKGGK